MVIGTLEKLRRWPWICLPELGTLPFPIGQLILPYNKAKTIYFFRFWKTNRLEQMFLFSLYFIILLKIKSQNNKFSIHGSFLEENKTPIDRQIVNSS
jgi:hypothetical protein